MKARILTSFLAMSDRETNNHVVRGGEQRVSAVHCTVATTIVLPVSREPDSFSLGISDFGPFSLFSRDSDEFHKKMYLGNIVLYLRHPLGMVLVEDFFRGGNDVVVTGTVEGFSTQEGHSNCFECL